MRYLLNHQTEFPTVTELASHCGVSTVSACRWINSESRPSDEKSIFSIIDLKTGRECLRPAIGFVVKFNNNQPIAMASTFKGIADALNISETSARKLTGESGFNIARKLNIKSIDSVQKHGRTLIKFKDDYATVEKWDANGKQIQKSEPTPKTMPMQTFEMIMKHVKNGEHIDAKYLLENSIRKKHVNKFDGINYDVYVFEGDFNFWIRIDHDGDIMHGSNDRGGLK